jgi:hypothetical protein
VSELTLAIQAASRLGQHPQDHGWREVYRLFAYGLTEGAPELTGAVQRFHQSRPADSFTHLFTLLGIALKDVSAELLGHLTDDRPPRQRLVELEAALRTRRHVISQILATRRNSFTSARRFLVPQVILGSYFRLVDEPARFADLGTGLGILPRQLNSARLYERFSSDLIWPGGIPAFAPIPFESRFAVDRGPFPNIDWVRSCYGVTEYYSGLYRELIAAMESDDVQRASVTQVDLDLLNAGHLGAFLAGQRVNAVNLSYVLYEVDPASRPGIIAAIRRSIGPPGLVVIMEPHDELGARGCDVTVFDQRIESPLRICAVSDGHFKGKVAPLEDFDEFCSLCSIKYS